MTRIKGVSFWAVSPAATYKKDFEDSVPESQRSTISFKGMVDKLKERYKPTKNSTLAHYEFHTLKQLPSESFDTFVNRVKHEANSSDFMCVAVVHAMLRIP